MVLTPEGSAGSCLLVGDAHEIVDSNAVNEATFKNEGMMRFERKMEQNGTDVT